MRRLYLALFLLSLSALAEHEENLAPARRRPLAQVRSWIKGTDLAVSFSQGTGACQTTSVAKNELNEPEGMCRLAYLTAAHCLVDEKNNFFKSIKLKGLGDIPANQIKTEIPQEYFQSAAEDPRAPRRRDMATLIFDVPCEQASHIKPVPLANVDKDGSTLVETSHVFLQKRESEAPGNLGKGVQITADVRPSEETDKFRFDVPSPQGYTIVGGDSGGPVFDQRGQLICPISASSYEYKKATKQLTKQRTSDDSILDPFTVVCDKRAISTLKLQLQKYGLSPASPGPADLTEVVPPETNRESLPIMESMPTGPVRRMRRTE
ncbi:MAG: hypothetical protein EB078_05885 [Proteobacteria bacterium]|nr:hypothetical protein [Pseudomonadota bacterium]NDC24529.1 hypothetical protein [Pseudomonadota bacterium]NDD04416.1 hypothetical protein [Pseudomonadota bacterium]NDG26909.1 hypothetical protein [Pseudomonadota bacterium]